MATSHFVVIAILAAVLAAVAAAAAAANAAWAAPAAATAAVLFVAGAVRSNDSQPMSFEATVGGRWYSHHRTGSITRAPQR